MMGSRLIVLHHDGWFLQEGRRKTVEPDIGYRFKPVGGPIRRPSATNGGSTLRGDEVRLRFGNLVIPDSLEKPRMEPLS